MRINFIRNILLNYGKSRIIKNGFWFVDIPRTSSTSIKLQLGNRFGITYSKKNIRGERRYIKGIFSDHENARDMKERIGDENWDQIFTFTIVRNPWDRAVSLYNYLHVRRNKIQSPVPTFRDHLFGLRDEYIRKDFHPKAVFKNGCYHYISDGNDIVVNKVIKYENREEGLREVSEKIGFNISPDIHHGKTQEFKSYKKHYDSETKEIIELIYAKDIEQFGYSFD